MGVTVCTEAGVRSEGDLEKMIGFSRSGRDIDSLLSTVASFLDQDLRFPLRDLRPGFLGRSSGTLRESTFLPKASHTYSDHVKDTSTSFQLFSSL